MKKKTTTKKRKLLKTQQTTLCETRLYFVRNFFDCTFRACAQRLKMNTSIIQSVQCHSLCIYSHICV